MSALRVVPDSRRILATLTLLFLGLVPGASGQARAEDLFQQALRMERISGDLEGAIGLYQKVVETGDHSLGARALIRIAESYEKLGRTGAQEAYARVIAEFGDQTEQVALARERLAALQPPQGAGAPEAPATQVRRLLMSDAGCYLEGIQPSPAGSPTRGSMWGLYGLRTGPSWPP